MTAEQKNNCIELDNKKSDQELVLEKLIARRDNAPLKFRERYNQALKKFCKFRGIAYESVIQDSETSSE